MSLQYKKQSVDVMKNILVTQATVVRAGAGGIDPFSGNAGTLQNYALATGVNEPVHHKGQSGAGRLQAGSCRQNNI